MTEARFQEREGERIRCRLCPHGCLLAEGQAGLCGVRRVAGGRLRALTAGLVAACHADPVEKKPLFHFLPGTATMSFAAPGCNLACEWCQNADLSQTGGAAPAGRAVAPERIVAMAAAAGCPSVSATWSEPTVFFELAREVGLEARRRGLRNVWVTNGFLGAPARRELVEWLDAANVDLKSMRDATYRRHCRGRLAPVLETIAGLKEAGVWVEVTTLVVPGINDAAAELREAARWLSRLDPDLPWHVTAFHPDYRMMDRPRTPAETLRRAAEIGREEGLAYVYTGNVEVPGGGDTRCSGCGELLLSRRGMGLEACRLAGRACPACGRLLPGRFV